MKNQFPSGRQYVYFFILCFAGILFWAITRNLFFFDEDIFVTGGKGIYLQNLWQRAALVKLSFIADNFFWGSNPAGYHYTNIALHLLNGVLGLLVLNQLLGLVANQFTEFQRAAIPYIFFILFLVSPVHSEPLGYILARGGVMVTLFLLLSVLFFLKSGYSKNLFIFFSLLSFLLALFSYEVSWTLPVIILSIMIFTSRFTQSTIKNRAIMIPYFLIFAAWFVFKVVLIDKMGNPDYKDQNLFSIGLGTMLKNGSVLFLRNFLPPFENSLTFLFAAILFMVLLLAGIVNLYKNNRTVFYLALLLVVITGLGLAATIVFGIDSHDSESERYVYFSSVFAVMLLSVVITFWIKNKTALIVFVIFTGSLYLFSLVKTIRGYDAAGQFAKTYLMQIDQSVVNGQKLFFVNLPSQHRGALLFRAQSRMNGNANGKVSIMQEYLQYLYNKNNFCVTLSAKELKEVPGKIVTTYKPADSIAFYFPKINLNPSASNTAGDNKDAYTFEKGDMVIALKDSMLYFFK